MTRLNRTDRWGFRTSLAGVVLAVTALPGAVGLVPAAAQPAEALAPTLAAHGGWDTWHGYQAMRYEVVGWPLGAQPNYTQTTALGPRYHLAESATYTAGVADDDAWITPDADALGLPPVFFLHGNFYFHAMPFVFADPGVNIRALESGELLGKTYDRLGASFSQGVGQTTDDDYTLYLDPETHRLHAINFSITHAAVRGEAAVAQAPRKVLVFEQWQESGGLLLPARATFHEVVDGRVDPQGASYTIHSIRLSRTAPDAAVFAAPSGAASR